jgi:hypothetical protein
MPSEDNRITIRVADFTIAPGARYREDGDGSAQEFFEDFVAPAIVEDESNQNAFCIDFDGTYGYASSFISELAKDIKTTYGNEFIRNRLVIKSDDDLMLADRFMRELNKEYEDT